ncbi:MAG TPA: enoyl-CoA hydratase/isomerase family protein [Pseudonocardia sp.]|jgi:enoyl-CoA hydratase
MSQDYKFSTIEVEIDEHILTATMNRPDQLNAVNGALHEDLEHLFARVAEDDEVDVVILTGAGRAFCAGGDVKGMADGSMIPAGGRHAPLTWFTGGPQRLIRNMLSVPQPMIAAVNGHAVGLGATLALFCDVVLVADNAKIGDTHTKVGLVAGDGGAVIWPLLVGVNRAKELLMTSELLSAAEAERLGLVNHVYPAAEVMPEAKALAERLAGMPLAAVRYTKQAVNKLLWERMVSTLDTSLAFEAISSTAGPIGRR